MAVIAKSGTPSVASLLPQANDKITGLYCGENLAIGDACYVKSDGKVWRATGAAANAAAKVDGYAATNAYVAQTDPVTLIDNCVWAYGSGLTPGASVYLDSTTPGALNDTATTGGTAPIGKVIDTTRIKLWSSRY
jgi:hypothetical protein